MLAQYSALTGKLIELFVFLNTYLWVLLKKDVEWHISIHYLVSYDRRGNGIDLNPGNFNLLQQPIFLIQG